MPAQLASFPRAWVRARVSTLRAHCLMDAHCAAALGLGTVSVVLEARLPVASQPDWRQPATVLLQRGPGAGRHLKGAFPRLETSATGCATFAPSVEGSSPRAGPTGTHIDGV